MLNLAVPTGPGWLDRVLPHLDELLVDHAHCEKKAAATALGLIFRHPERPELVVPLSRLAREELAHFEEVVEAIERRGGRFRRLAPSPYAPRLLSTRRDPEPERLLDTLLAAALIEARSCERMTILAEHLPDADLRRLYRGLLASEARHHASYLDLARPLVPEADFRRRLAELSAHEARVLADAPPEPRMHN